MLSVRGKVVSLQIGEINGQKYGQIMVDLAGQKVNFKYDMKSVGRIPEYDDIVIINYEDPERRTISSIEIDMPAPRKRTHVPAPQPQRTMIPPQRSTTQSQRAQSQRDYPDEVNIDVFELARQAEQTGDYSLPQRNISSTSRDISQYSDYSKMNWPRACINCVDAQDQNMRLYTYRWSQKHVTESGGTTCLRACCFGAACAYSTRKKDVTHQMDIPLQLCSSCEDSVKSKNDRNFFISLIVFAASVMLLFLFFGRVIPMPVLPNPSMIFTIIIGLFALPGIATTFLYLYYRRSSKPYLNFIRMRAPSATAKETVVLKSQQYAEVFSHLNPQAIVRIDTHGSGSISAGDGCCYGLLVTILLFFFVPLFLL